MLIEKPFRRLTGFFGCERGGVTVEAVLWVPIYAVLFTLVADVSMIFHGQAMATRIAYDGNRQASVGTFETEAAVETAVLARLQPYSPNATADTVFGAEAITTTVTLPANDLVAIGAITQFVDVNITFSSVHMNGV
ncbi:MAG: hypothetical protein HKN18_11220 [Silicimonas sp.]|nr:hypothetical protein [Silicimonas sp.]